MEKRKDESKFLQEEIPKLQEENKFLQEEKPKLQEEISFYTYKKPKHTYGMTRNKDVFAFRFSFSIIGFTGMLVLKTVFCCRFNGKHSFIISTVYPHL